MVTSNNLQMYKPWVVLSHTVQTQIILKFRALVVMSNLSIEFSLLGQCTNVHTHAIYVCVSKRGGGGGGGSLYIRC